MRIRRLIPQARLIAVLRDPVERAHSNWTHLWSAGLEPIGDFVRACEEEPRRIEAGWASFWHYTSVGRYGEQLEHLYRVFPREQVLVLRYLSLVDSPAETLDRICAFLGVATGILTEIPRENVTTHPEHTLAHRAAALGMRAGAAAGRALPGNAAIAAIHRLERFLQRGRRERQPPNAAPTASRPCRVAPVRQPLPVGSGGRQSVAPPAHAVAGRAGTRAAA